MNKKAIAPILMVVLIAASIGLFFSGEFLLSIIADDYAIYFDETQTVSLSCPPLAWETGEYYQGSPIYRGSQTCEDNLFTGEVFSRTSPYTLTGSSWILVENGEIVMKGNTGASLTTKRDFRGNDVKTSFYTKQTSSVPQYTSISVFFGGQEVFTEKINFNKEYNIEIINSVISPNSYDIFVNGANVKRLTFDPAQELKLYYGIDLNSAELHIRNIKFKIPFSCNVENDEVLLRDTFSAGSKIQIIPENTLSQNPLKLCLDFNPIVRDFEAQGVKEDKLGELLQILSRGGSYKVGQNQEVYLFYIADYKAGINERCELGQAWDTISKTCEQRVIEAPDETIIVNDKVTIYEGINKFSSVFEGDTTTIGDGSNSISIGDLKYKVNKPSFSCADETKFDSISQQYEPVNRFGLNQPRAECWTTKLEFAGTSYDKISSPYKLDSAFLTFDYELLDATWDREDGVSHWKSVNTVTLKNYDWLDATTTRGDFFVPIGSQQKVKITIVNDLANFDSGGIIVKKTADFFFRQTEERLEFSVQKGANSYELTLPTDVLHENFILVTPFVRFEGRDFVDDKSLVYNYYVYGDGEDISSITTKEGSASEVTSLKQDQIGVLTTTTTTLKSTGSKVTSLFSTEKGSFTLPSLSTSKTFLLIVFVLIGIFALLMAFATYGFIGLISAFVVVIMLFALLVRYLL